MAHVSDCEAPQRGMLLGLMLCCVMLLPTGLRAAESAVLQAEEGRELVYRRYAGSGDDLLIWLPSERGLAPAHELHARSLAAAGVEVWAADLHDSYFLQPGRASLAQVPLVDVVRLIEAAARDKPRVFLFSSSRGAQLALLAAREWQLANPGSQGLRGVVLSGPNLFAERPEPGAAADYLPITAATNLPLYVIEPEYSTGYQHLNALVEALGRGGAPVFSQRVAGVIAGFHVRPESDLKAPDLTARAAFAVSLGHAMRLLASQTPPDRALHAEQALEFAQPITQRVELRRLENPLPAPDFSLPDESGRTWNSRQLRGKVLLVNFWASWCGPCVEEIPSLSRLRQRLSGTDFEILAINIGEDAARIAGFRQRVPIDFLVLLDAEGRTTRDWKVYVYPSNYIVDRQGRIVHAHLGALEWDRDDLVELLRRVLADS